MPKNSFRLGRILGVQVFIDWSWLIILALVTWNLAAGVFPQVHREWSPALKWGLGLIAALVFFASILAHELSHARVALSRGLPVDRITLFMFGGVASIEREPDTAGDEFVIAIAGPAMSLLLGGVFLLMAGVSGALGRLFEAGSLRVGLAQLSPLTTLMLWLGPINIILAIFNMLPGFPLDGGRVLRSILWAASKDFKKATLWASTIGQAVAWAFILGGVAMILGVRLPFFGTGIFSGLWLGFIGWFLRNAAVQSYQQVMVNDILSNVPVSTLMNANVRSVPADLRVSQLITDFVNVGDERCFPVVDNGQMAGMVCIDDIRKVRKEDWYGTSVRSIMTHADQLETVQPGEDANQAFNLLTSQAGMRPVAVVEEGGRLVGLLRRKDIARWLQIRGGLNPRKL